MHSLTIVSVCLIRRIHFHRSVQFCCGKEIVIVDFQVRQMLHQPKRRFDYNSKTEFQAFPMT